MTTYDHIQELRAELAASIDAGERQQIAAELERKQVSLQVLDQNIHTGDATGRLLFNMLGAIA